MCQCCCSSCNAMYTYVITKMHKTKVNEKTRISYMVAVVPEGYLFPFIIWKSFVESEYIIIENELIMPLNEE